MGVRSVDDINDGIVDNADGNGSESGSELDDYSKDNLYKMSTSLLDVI